MRRATPPTWPSTTSPRTPPTPQCDPFDVEEVDNGFKACVGDSPDQCATWTDLEGKDGKLANFTVNGRKLDELLVDLRGQPPIESPGLYSVQPDWAYRQPTSGRLYVVCTVTAIDVPLSSRPGTYIEEDQIFEGCRRRAGSRDHQAR